jgi:pre-mRNA-splicing factor ATP-dependent RNA helicase DHX15/PRP43
MEIKAPRNYKIETIFSPKTLDYDATLKECFKTLIHILETDDVNNTKKAHDIIIFVTSSNDAFKLCKQLNDYQENEKGKQCKITCNDKQVYCVEVYSGMDPKKELLATDINLYQQQGKYNRKVVIGTNVAESSLTIDGLCFVINCCYEFNSSFDPINSARKLDRELIAQSSAIQRAGRAGRTEPGICYHLCSEHDFNNTMLKYPLPDILTSDITMECIQLLATPLIPNTKKLLQILTQFVAAPKQSYIEYSLSVLMQIDAVENEVLTPLGKLLIKIPCNNLFMSLAILYGKIYDCSRELLKIASLIEVSKANINDLFNSPNMRDFSKEGHAKIRKFEEVKKKMANKYGDHLTLLYIFDEYNLNKKDPKTLDKFCRDHFLKPNLLAKAANNYKTTKHQLQMALPDAELKTLDIKLFPDVNKMEIEDRILFCLLAGLRLNTAVNKKGSEYYRANLSNLDKIKLHKFSFLNYAKKKPANVMYYELFMSMGRAELSIVSVIPEHIVKIVS